MAWHYIENLMGICEFVWFGYSGTQPNLQ